MKGLTFGGLWRIAIRDLRRNRRRSLLTLLAVAIGLALVIFTSGLMTGSVDGALENNIRQQTGHLQVRAATYEEEKVDLAWEDLLADPYATSAQIQELEQVRVASPVLWASGILGTRDESVGVRVFGIDTQSEAQEFLRDGLVAGEYLVADDRAGILMGQRLADNLDLAVGSQVNLLVNTADEAPDEARFTIRGLFNSNVPSYDDTTIFLPIAKAQAFTRTGDRASAIFILLHDKEDATTVAGLLESPSNNVLAWEELNKVLMQSVDMSAGIMNLMYFVVLAVVAVVIANTLLMAVYERTREMGILAALGMKGRQITFMFLLEATALALTGILVGLLLGGLLVAYVAKVGWHIGDMATVGSAAIGYGNTIYTKFSLPDALSLALAGLAITLIASLYPAIMAARLEPIDALRAQ